MVEVVFSDSEKGAMRYGQSFTRKGKSATAVVLARTDGEQPTQEEYDAALAAAQRRQEQVLKNGKPNDVIGLSFALDIGDIALPIDDSRRDLIARMLSSDPWNELQDMENSINRYWGGCVSNLNKLITRAKTGESVRIWYSEAPYSMCGFYDTVYQLKDCECRISAVKLPGYTMPIGEHEAKAVISWGEIDPGELAYYLPLESEIPGIVRKAVVAEWEKLKQENAPLRTVVNGKLHSVEMDFYDSFILKEIPDAPFKVAQLIGLVLGRNQLGIGDWLIAQRIRRMLESGELAVIQADSAFYNTMLKRSF